MNKNPIFTFTQIYILFMNKLQD